MEGFRNLQPRNQAQAHLTTKEPKGTPRKNNYAKNSELGELNVEEINKLKLFLKTIQNGSCSLAQTSTCLNSENFTTSQTIINGL